jgi:DNA polymerase III subunit beta
MHVSIQKAALVRSLKEVSSALPGRSVQPILSHICLSSIDETTVLFKATDLDLFIQSKCNAVVNAPGAIALPGKKLLEIVSKFPEDLISFRVNKDTQETSIQCGRTKISLSSMLAEDFPAMGETEASGIFIPADSLCTAIAQTAFSAASFDTGSVIGGVYISINNGEFECVATDGNRLAYRRDLLTVNVISSAKSESIEDRNQTKRKQVATLEKPVSMHAVVPARACSEVFAITSQKISGQSNSDVRISMSNGLISFQTEESQLSTRLISGEYPAFKELFPSECKYMATFDRQELITTLDRVAVMADEKKHLIKLHFENESMQITANTPDFGKAEDEVPMKFDGQVLDIVVNVRYLLDVLRAVSSNEIVIEMNGSLQPMIVKEKDKENYKYLLMPVELRTA